MFSLTTWLLPDLSVNSRTSTACLKLRGVMIEDADIKPVYEGMTRCSNFTHEGGAEAPPPLPTPDEFIGDIEALGAAVNAITTVPKENLPDWLHGATRFIPLVLTKDDIGSSWMTTTYLNARFKQLLGMEKIDTGVVTQLLGMSVATLERAVYALTETALSDILENRINEDPQLGRPFEAASTYIYRGMPRRMSKHIEILHVLAQELEEDFQLKG